MESNRTAGHPDGIELLGEAACDLSPWEALRLAVQIISSQSATGRLLGVTQATVWKWLNKSKLLPAEHVLKVEAATGVSRYDLRPDIYPRESIPARRGAHDFGDNMAPVR